MCRVLWPFVLVCVLGCQRGQEKKEGFTMQVTSSAFPEGVTIPKKFTADGADVSPALQWQGASPTTKSFALICDDPDAPRGTWVHWVLFNLPADTQQLPEGVPPEKTLAGGARH